MIVAHFNTFDSGGGAAKASMRLHQALLEAGCDSTLFVASKITDVARVERIKTIGTRLCRVIDEHALRVLNPQTVFFPDLLGTPITPYIQHIKQAQVIHLHWIANFLSSRRIHQLYQRTHLPIVWTLLDMAPFTGGCHYAWECAGYKTVCGQCPQIRSSFNYDVSHWTWRQKRNNLTRLPITVVAGSSWLADRARESSLFCNFPIVRISVGIDDRLFHPIDAERVQEQWKLPTNTKILFFGASSLSDERKGMRYLLNALHVLKARLSAMSSDMKILLLIAGDPATNSNLDLPFPAHWLGYLQNDITLAMAYQASDIFVCPSIEDAGPMMIPESMMCGTPVVAFNSGGAPDLIETGQNGYLATRKDSSDLANGIYLMLSSLNLEAMRAVARERAVRLHSVSVVTAQYLDLYHSLVFG